MTCEQTIQNSLAKVASKTFKENAWGARHAQAWHNPKGFERPIVAFYQALAQYADTHAARFGSPMAEDYVLGKEGWFPMLRTLRVLLNGELGRLDAGTLDALTYELGEAAGYTRAEMEA